MRIALVMGSGGPSGSLWMRTILEELHSAIGFSSHHARTIIGTSAGAYVGADAAEHEPPNSDVADAISSLARPLPDWRPNLGAYWLRRSLGRVVGLAAIRGKHDPRQWVLPDPKHKGLRTVTTTAVGSRRVAVAHGPNATDEIAASGAVPFFNKPVRIDGQRLTDGAIWSATNADLVDPDEFDLLMLFAPHATLDAKTLSFTGLHRVQVGRELSRWRESGKPCVWFIPEIESYARRGDRHHVVQDAKALVAASLK